MQFLGGLYRYLLKLKASQVILVLSALLFISPLHAQETPIGTGDILTIQVFGHPDLTTKVQIPDDGYITFPLIGRIQLGGLSRPQAEQSIASALIDQGFLKRANVGILMDEVLSIQVSLLGEVIKPGRYPLQGNIGLLEVIAQAGGQTEAADDFIILIRNEAGSQKEYRIYLRDLVANGEWDKNFPLKSGDIIYVPKQTMFYIYGEVRQPGMYPVRSPMTVMKALSVAGGVTNRGSHSRVLIKRRDANGETEEIKAELTDVIQSEDVLFVKERIF